MAQMVGLVVFFIVLYIVLFAGVIVNYILTSLSLHTIAKRRLISKPWLAWIPVASVWTVGSIADDYDARMNINRKWRVVLLTLTLVFYAVFMIMYIAMFVMVFSFVMEHQIVSPLPEEVVAFVIPISLFVTVISVVGMALSICTYICMFKIFESTVSHKALKYFLLSMFVPFASAICLFLSRNQGYSNTPANSYYSQNNQY